MSAKGNEDDGMPRGTVFSIQYSVRSSVEELGEGFGEVGELVTAGAMVADAQGAGADAEGSQQARKRNWGQCVSK